jgi:hypothetical protein
VVLKSFAWSGLYDRIIQFAQVQIFDESGGIGDFGGSSGYGAVVSGLSAT